MKITTWNVNSLRVRLPQLLEWLAANPVDVIGIQETKLTATRTFPPPKWRPPAFLLGAPRPEDL